MAQPLAPHHALALDPIELHNAARSTCGRMTVPGILGDAEGEQSPRCRRHFGDHVLKALIGAQQAQASTRRLP